jgi:hypothetical protein
MIPFLPQERLSTLPGRVSGDIARFRENEEALIMTMKQKLPRSLARGARMSSSASS